MEVKFTNRNKSLQKINQKHNYPDRLIELIDNDKLLLQNILNKPVNYVV